MGAQPPWPSDFSELKKLEDILQCSICYEYINTCMMTPCSHNFCSLCIRKYLQFKTQCPSCFQETHGSDLRKNRLVDDVIGIWVKLKDRLLFNLRLINMTQSIKNDSKSKLECNELDSPSTSTNSVRNEAKSANKEFRTPKSGKNKSLVVQKLFSEKKTSPDEDEARPIVLDGIVIPSMFQPQKSPKKTLTKKPEDMSSCPVCNVDVPLKNLNIHLDSCLVASDPDTSRLKPKPEKREPIPKRVYSLMKEKDLKKYLKDYGLSTFGDRKAMITRLTRYIVLYNAECDKECPRAVSDLIKQVEREEKDEKSTQSNPLFQASRLPVLPHDKKKDPEAIEKANKEYLESNRENFKKLIENMRARDGKNIKPLKPLNRIGSDDENDETPSRSTSTVDLTSSSSGGLAEGDTGSVYSQVTICDSDSDSNDILDESPQHKAGGEVGRIDWEKTGLDEEESGATQGSYDPDQTIVPIGDDSDSYDSVFNTSATSESAKTPKSNSTRTAQEKNKTPPEKGVKIGEKFEEIFQNDEGAAGSEKEEETHTVVQNGEKTSDSSEEEEATESEESEDDDDDEDASVVGTPANNYDISPEISPMRRLTRSSVKRKLQTDERKTAATEPKMTRSKKVKHSASPVN